MVVILAVIAINIKMLKSESVDIMPLVEKYEATIKERDLKIKDLQMEIDGDWEFRNNRCVCKSYHTSRDIGVELSREEICKN